MGKVLAKNHFYNLTVPTIFQLAVPTTILNIVLTTSKNV